MMAPANIAASVRQRLLNLARVENRPFNELLQYYAMERFLYRLSRSGHSERFILKGALMLRVWNFPAQRPTMDIDLLGMTSNRPEDVIEPTLFTPLRSSGLKRPERVILGALSRTARSNALSASWFGPPFA
jgi:hypothetical protein